MVKNEDSLKNSFCFVDLYDIVEYKPRNIVQNDNYGKERRTEMKRLLTILLILLLLFLSACGKGQTETERSVPSVPVPPVTEEELVPEPELEPADPRALWAAAAAYAKAYDNMEYEDRRTFYFQIFQEDEVLRQTTVFRGKDMNSMEMKLEAVTTGDDPRAYYFADSTYYVDTGINRRSCAMTTEAFWAYIREETLPFGPEHFETVELISEEDGWEIAFSDPTEDYISILQTNGFSEWMRIREDTITLEGTVRLDKEGYYLEDTMELSCEVTVYRNSEAFVTQSSTRRWLSHDEPVTVILPKNLEGYTPVEDIRLASLSDRALRNHNRAYAAEYEEWITFSGSVGGINCALEIGNAVAFQIDVENSRLRLRKTNETATTVSGKTETDGFEMAIENSRQTVIWDDGSETEETIRENEAIDGIWSNFVVLTNEARQACYEEPVYTLEDGACTVLMTPDIHLSELLFPYAFYAMELQANGGVFNVIDYEIRESSGELIIEEETGRLQKVSIFVDGTFTLADGTVFEGTVLMEQTFLGYDREVVIAPGADGVRHP